MSGELRLGDEIIIEVPSGAAEQELHIIVEKVRETAGLLTDQGALVSAVFEVLKNISADFKKPVTISLKFDRSQVGAGQRVALFYYDEDNQRWIEIGGVQAGDWVTAEVDHFTKFAVLAVDDTFTDIAGHWGASSILAAASQRLISGYPDGTFKPDHPVTRAEFTVMLVNALQLHGTGGTVAFSDQDKIGPWALPAIAAAVERGIVSGYEDGSFRPDAFITRAEMAVMVAKALGVKLDGPEQTGFADDDEIPAWAKGAVAQSRQLGIISGRGGNRFEANATATRAEAVVVLLRLLEINDTF